MMKTCTVIGVSLGLFLLITQGRGQIKRVAIEVNPDSNPLLLAQEQCKGEYVRCRFLAQRVIELYQNVNYNKTLDGWKYNDACRCNMPPPPQRNEQPSPLQYLHIPKCGTSFNWHLHAYFPECPIDEKNPCPTWQATAEEQSAGLCDGRLYSCKGHRVFPNLFELAVSKPTNMVTMLREPFHRLQSSYHYLKGKPESNMLSPEINISELLMNVSNLYEFTAFPGISNCMTKMLNGIQCGENVELTNEHLEKAKIVLSTTVFFGITEKFKTSVCMMGWIYGGPVAEYQFGKFRESQYVRRTMQDEFTEEQISGFKERERFDYGLYEFANEYFDEMLSFTKCPLID